MCSQPAALGDEEYGGDTVLESWHGDSYVLLFLVLCTLWIAFHLPARHFQG